MNLLTIFRCILLEVLMATWIMYVLLSLFISTGNFLVIMTIAFTKSLHSNSNLLVASLSIADLCLGIILLPMKISENMNAPWTTTIEYCRISHGLVLMNLSASMLHIAVIAIDRYIAAYHPFRYEAITVNKWGIWIQIALTWFISLMLAFSPSMGLGANSQSGKRKLTGLCIFKETLHPQYLLFYSCCIFFGSFIVVTVLYLRLYILARKHIQRITALEVIPLEEVTQDKSTIEEPVSTSSVHSTIQKKKNKTRKGQRRIAMELKSAKVMAMVVGALYICWVPNIASIILTAVCKKCLNQVAISIIVFIVYFNSGLNPIIYYSRLSTYREATKRMLRRIYQH